MLKRILPHVCIDVAVIFIVLWVIDRFNGAMHMLSRDIFKIPFFIFLLLVIVESVLLIVHQRRELDDPPRKENTSASLRRRSTTTGNHTKGAHTHE
jgi:hypothetical protein